MGLQEYPPPSAGRNDHARRSANQQRSENPRPAARPSTVDGTYNTWPPHAGPAGAPSTEDTLRQQLIPQWMDHAAQTGAHGYGAGPYTWQGPNYQTGSRFRRYWKGLGADNDNNGN